MTARGRATSGVGLLGAGLLAVGAAGWLEVPATTALSAEVLTVPGSTAVPAAPAAALVLLAAGLALVLAGRVARVVAAVTVSAAGVLVVVATAGFLADPSPVAVAALAESTGVRRLDVAPVLTPWPVVALVLGALAGGAGVLLLWLSRRWPTGTAARFERATPPVTAPGRAVPDAGDAAPARAMDDWDALSRGEDPS